MAGQLQHGFRPISERGAVAPSLRLSLYHSTTAEQQYETGARALLLARVDPDIAGARLECLPQTKVMAGQLQHGFRPISERGAVAPSLWFGEEESTAVGIADENIGRWTGDNYEPR